MSLWSKLYYGPVTAVNGVHIPEADEKFMLVPAEPTRRHLRIMHDDGVTAVCFSEEEADTAFTLGTGHFLTGTIHLDLITNQEVWMAVSPFGDPPGAIRWIAEYHDH